MSLVVGVHGIGQQFKGANVLHEEWYPPLCDGLALVGAKLDRASDLTCAYYGDLFRPSGTKGVGQIPYDASDVTDEDEQQLLEAWWHEAARVEKGRVPDPADATKGRTHEVVQRALNALSYSRFFASIAESVEEYIIADLKQVSAYLRNAVTRQKMHERVAAVVSEDTRVMVGHSLGSVVAYECLCAHPDWPVRTLVTLGSPLGIRNLVFDRLKPSPIEGRGAWPGSVRHWFNIADGGDIVALVKNLRGCFGERVEDRLIHNGADAHYVRPYLTARETGDAIATGLR
jgi:hypothetical protein